MLLSTRSCSTRTLLGVIGYIRHLLHVQLLLHHSLFIPTACVRYWHKVEFCCGFLARKSWKVENWLTYYSVLVPPPVIRGLPVWRQEPSSDYRDWWVNNRVEWYRVLFAIFENGHYAADQVYFYSKRSANLAARSQRMRGKVFTVIKFANSKYLPFTSKNDRHQRKF